MFATFKQIFRSSNKDLRKRILFTLGVLFIFALGNSITIPGMDVINRDIGFLELFNALSGIYDLIIEMPTTYAAYGYGKLMFTKLHDEGKAILGAFYEKNYKK